MSNKINDRSEVHFRNEALTATSQAVAQPDISEFFIGYKQLGNQSGLSADLGTTDLPTIKNKSEKEKLSETAHQLKRGLVILTRLTHVCAETSGKNVSAESIAKVLASEELNKCPYLRPLKEKIDLEKSSTGEIDKNYVLTCTHTHCSELRPLLTFIRDVAQTDPQFHLDLKDQGLDIDESLRDLNQLETEIEKLILELNAVIESEQNRSMLGIASAEMESNSELIREARQKLEKLFDELVYSLQMQNSNSEKLMEKIRKALPAYLLKEVAFDRLFPFYTEMNAIDNLLEARQSLPFDKSHKRELEFCVENCKNHLFHIFRSIKVASPDRDSPFNFFTHLKKVFRESLKKPNTVFSSRQA